MLKDRKVDKNILVCDDRLKCQILVDDKFVIEIQENMPVNYRRQKMGDYRLMTRGRLADALAREHGLTYIGISYLEMEYCANEAEYLLKLLSPIYS